MPAHRKYGEVSWSATLAYAVGLITTDGNLSTDGRHICLTSKDIEQLCNFKDCLGLKNKIGTKIGGLGSISHMVQFSNVVFYRWLIDIGLTPNKTKTIGPLKIPDKFFFEFLRGHLDGDGSISRYNDKVYPKSQRLYVTFCSASKKHIVWIQESITRLLGLSGYIEKRYNNKVIEYLHFAKRESRILLPKIYENKSVPFLERKFRIISDLI